MHRLTVTSCFVLVISSVSARATAQSTPLPDVVLTEDGGMVRGTIIESVPDDHVTILLPSGESRTIGWDSVRYAGPESERPASRADSSTPPAPSRSSRRSAQAPVPEGVDEVSVRVVSDQQGLFLHRVQGGRSELQHTHVATYHEGHLDLRPTTQRVWTREYSRLCEVPCRLSLLPGRYELAVTAGGLAQQAGELDIRRDGTLHVAYSDQSAWRVLGWILWPLGLVGGSLFIPGMLALSGDLTASLAGGLSMIGGGALLGFSMIAAGDGAVIRFE